MTADHPAPERITLELWVWCDRDRLEEVHERVVTRFERLKSMHIIDGAEVREWNHQLDLSSQDVSEETEATRARVAQFKAWAEAHGVDLPFPEPCVAGRGRGGVEYVSQDLPAVLLAEFWNDELYCITPFAAGDEYCSVSNRLDQLEDTTNRESGEKTACV